MTVYVHWHSYVRYIKTSDIDRGVFCIEIMAISRCSLYQDDGYIEMFALSRFSLYQDVCYYRDNIYIEMFAIIVIMSISRCSLYRYNGYIEIIYYKMVHCIKLFPRSKYSTTRSITSSSIKRMFVMFDFTNFSL